MFQLDSFPKMPLGQSFIEDQGIKIAVVSFLLHRRQKKFNKKDFQRKALYRYGRAISRALKNDFNLAIKIINEEIRRVSFLRPSGHWSGIGQAYYIGNLKRLLAMIEGEQSKP